MLLTLVILLRIGGFVSHPRKPYLHTEIADAYSFTRHTRCTRSPRILACRNLQPTHLSTCT